MVHQQRRQRLDGMTHDDVTNSGALNQLTWAGLQPCPREALSCWGHNPADTPWSGLYPLHLSEVRAAGARLGGASRLPHCYWFTALRGVEPLPNKTDKLRFCEPVKSRILPGHTHHFELDLLLQQLNLLRFPRRREAMDLVYLVCLALSIGAWFASAERHSVYWNSSNPNFLWMSTQEVRINDYLDIICPHHTLMGVGCHRRHGRAPCAVHRREDYDAV
ncbi:ephrin-A1 [Lates japonicus]|uniref:Ephrin-A1 n=1 Tax=Lates japonicus TaxID=270547 RepID=A0AAD3RJK8_LATJO|nr:ephrin-A1 [Lates japonicus]